MSDCRKFVRRVVLLNSLLLVSTANIYAAEEVHQWGGELDVGLENDSTVIIDELDSVVNESSSSKLLRFNLNYEYNPDDANQWLISGNYIKKNFSESDQFDSALQIYSASYSREFEKFTLGLRAQAIDSDLNSNSFLKMNQVSPYVSFFVGKQWLVNLSMGLTDKSITTDDARSATGTEISVDSYRFIQGINHYLLFSYKSHNEQAEDDLFSQVGNQFRLGWVKKFRLFDKVNKVRLNWRYTRRNYNDEIHPQIDTFRVDNRRQWELEWELTLNEAFNLMLNYRQNEQDSKLEAASYDQKISSVTLQYQF